MSYICSSDIPGQKIGQVAHFALELCEPLHFIVRSFAAQEDLRNPSNDECGEDQGDQDLDEGEALGPAKRSFVEQIEVHGITVVGKSACGKQTPTCW